MEKGERWKRGRRTRMIYIAVNTVGGGTKNDKKRMKEGSENERGRGDVNHRRLHKREVVNYTLSGPLVSM